MAEKFLGNERLRFLLQKYSEKLKKEGYNISLNHRGTRVSKNSS